MEKPFCLNYLETLEARINLPDDAKKRLWEQRTGFEGHQAFDDILQAFVPQDCGILHNLNFNLEVGKCQIDSLLITTVAIYHFEVKMMVGEAEYRGGEWYSVKNGMKYRNYSRQMDRQSEILIGIFNSLGITVPIICNLVLINDQDTVKINDESVREMYLKRW